METYRHVSQIINTNLNHTKGLLAPENTPYALPFTFLRGAKPGPSARCHGRPAQRGVSRRRGVRTALADAFARRPRRQRLTFALRERDRLFRA